MLHIISNPNAIEACAVHLLDKDEVIFIGDSVYGLTDAKLDSRVPVYALETDLAAREITTTSNVTLANMTQFVRLVVQHTSSVTWT